MIVDTVSTPAASDEGPATVTATLRDCPHCQGVHEGLTFVSLGPAAVAGLFTHFTYCPRGNRDAVVVNLGPSAVLSSPIEGELEKVGGEADDTWGEDAGIGDLMRRAAQQVRTLAALAGAAAGGRLQAYEVTEGDRLAYYLAYGAAHALALYAADGGCDQVESSHFTDVSVSRAHPGVRYSMAFDRPEDIPAGVPEAARPTAPDVRRFWRVALPFSTWAEVYGAPRCLYRDDDPAFAESESEAPAGVDDEPDPGE